MKKTNLFAAAVIAAAIGLGSCQNTPKPNLSDEVDTLSYAIGMAQSRGLKPYVSMRMGVDTVKYMNDFLRGVLDGTQSANDSSKLAYLAGIQIGQQLANQMVKGLNYQLSGNDSTEVLDVENFLAGFFQAVKGEPGLYTMEEAANVAEEKMAEFQRRQMEEKYGENRAAGEKYLAEVAKNDSVQKLPSGVMYKVLVEGNGEIPADTSRVKVHYEGTLPDGTVFDSSIKRGEPTTFRCNQVIKGWTEALTHMPVGSKWVVYIPQELAYGERETGLIKPFSALTFTIELFSIEK